MTWRPRWAFVPMACALLACSSGEAAPLRFPPVLVQAPMELPPVVVVGANTSWFVAVRRPPRYGEPVPVRVTMYCLTGTTRRGRYVRPGIVAADPHYFPLSRYIELYVGDEYYGRFLVDDTGKRIKGPHIDVWTPACHDARLFGVQHGTAVLVPRPHREATIIQAGRPSPSRAAAASRH